MSVFTFGLMQQKIVADHEAAKKDGGSFTLSEVDELFRKCQMELAVVEIHRTLGLRVKPLPLFTFSDDDAFEFFPK